MRKLLLALTFLGFCGLAEAQEVYTLNANATQVGQLDRARAAKNRQTCQRYALPTTCTQAQVCTAASSPGGAACTPAQARAANVRVYPQTQAGREEFIGVELVLPAISIGTGSAAADERKAACSWFNLQTQPTKDAECSKWGLDVGCNPCE